MKRGKNVSDNGVSLWPDEIRAEVQSPTSILIGQAKALTKQTGGVLVGKVTTAISDDDTVLLNFNIMVPELGDYQHRIIVVRHQKDMHYPAVVDAEVFRTATLAGLRSTMKAIASMAPLLAGEPDDTNPLKKPDNRADSDTELIELVAKVLRSPYVVSVAQSLIARVGDVRGEKEREANPLSGKEPPKAPATAPEKNDTGADGPAMGG